MCSPRAVTRSGHVRVFYSVQRTAYSEDRRGQERTGERIGVTKLKDEREDWIGDRGSSMCTFRTSESSVFLAKRVLHAGGRPTDRASIVDRGSWIACFAYITRISPRESWGNWNVRRSVTVTQDACASQLRRLNSIRLDRLHGAEPEPEPGTDGRTDELKLKS